MNIKFLFSSLLILVFNPIFTQNSNDQIFWSENVKLNWTNFKAKPDKNSKAAALSSLSIPYIIKGYENKKIYVQIRTCFNQSKSWSKQNYQSENLLLHEQIHFNIAELHRRMIVKELQEINWTQNNINKGLNEVISSYWNKKYSQMQDLYDIETDFSRNRKKQKQWEVKINNLLKEYEQYKDEEFYITQY